jgi:zinc protease
VAEGQSRHFFAIYNRVMFRYSLAMLLGVCALPAIEPLPVKTGQLSNGMKVIVEEDRDIPNVAMYLFYRIGSRNEVPGKTGLAHFFEHMMFNGAKKYGPKQFDIVMEKNGGRNNAYTSEDLTVYTNFIPNTALDVTFDLEADRIRDLALEPKLVESERGVVYSERRLSVDNNNMGTLHEQLISAAYTAHPYQWSVIGWPSDIEGWTMDDLKAHFKMGYAPNNCTLVVVGATSFEEVMRLAQKHLEPIPAQTPPPPVRTKEPEQKGERRVKIEKSSQLPMLMVGYHVGNSMDPDYAALTVFDALLTAGRSARLTKRLVDGDRLAIQVGAQNPMQIDPGLFYFLVQPGSGIAPEKAEAALYEEIEKLKKEPVSAKEIEKARNLILGAFYQQLKTIAGKANLLGQYEIYFGGYDKLFNFDKLIAAVTPADIQRVAAKYFTERNRTVATLVPTKAEGN